MGYRENRVDRSGMYPNASKYGRNTSLGTDKLNFQSTLTCFLGVAPSMVFSKCWASALAESLDKSSSSTSPAGKKIIFTVNITDGGKEGGREGYKFAIMFIILVFISLNNSALMLIKCIKGTLT